MRKNGIIMPLETTKYDELFAEQSYAQRWPLFRETKTRGKLQLHTIVGNATFVDSVEHQLPLVKVGT